MNLYILNFYKDFHNFYLTHLLDLLFILLHFTWILFIYNTIFIYIQFHEHLWDIFCITIPMITSAIMNQTIQGITQRNFKQCSRDVNGINQPEQHKLPVLPVHGGHDTIQYEWNQLLNIRETLITNKYFKKIDHRCNQTHQEV